MVKVSGKVDSSDCAVRLVSAGWDPVGCPLSNQDLDEDKNNEFLISDHLLESVARLTLKPILLPAVMEISFEGYRCRSWGSSEK